MNSPPATAPRFVGLDVHKGSVVVAAIDAAQQVLLPPRRVPRERFVAWAEAHLTPTDVVVLEATTDAWQVHDELRPLVADVTVAHPLLVQLIAATKVKTDGRDAVHLARLLAAGLIPAVWVPPVEVRELRGLLSHRQRLVRQRTQARNRLHAVLHRHHLAPPEGALFAAAQRDWWAALPLGATELLRVRQDLALLASLDTLVGEVERELARLSTVEPWASQAAFLLQLPGIGVVNAMALLAAIGDIARFPTAKKLVGYAGLGAGVHQSGQTRRTGGITKQGRRELRAALVEAAWVAVRTHPRWRAVFTQLEQRRGSGKAIVAVARKLLVVAWHVLQAREADRHADAAQVARKFFSWSERVGKVARGGESAGTLVRRELTRLGIGANLTRVTRGGQVCRVPPASAATG
ncbi:MAG TPA: IS110 family transposase [Solirubrobacteraceae bacterium]|nr:IS110 family transposase [Solirubrobacteraceae bacterium]